MNTNETTNTNKETNKFIVAIKDDHKKRVVLIDSILHDFLLYNC
jgi:hypothetical protein